MRRAKKVLLLFLGTVLFVLMTAMFTSVITERMLPEETVPETMNREAYPYAVTVETEPPTEPTVTEETILETVPEETVPPTEPRIQYDEVPRMYMTDYPEILYRSGTVASSGSNVASLAMVASYLTGHEYTPGDLAEYFADYIGNSMQWLEYASDQLQLPWKKAENFHVAKQALREGKVVIVLLGEKSIFTQSQHFIVLAGLNEAGKILVNDPYEPHYTQWNLEKGLAEGFEDVSVVTGYHGAWIYDPAAMGDFLYEPEPNTDEFRYPGIELTQADKDLMAKLLCMEGESETFEAQQAMAEVILNRLAAGNFQSSIENIIYAEGQFASANRLYLAEPTHIQYEAIDRAYNGPYRLPKDVVFFSAGKVNDNVYEKIGAHWFCYQW